MPWERVFVYRDTDMCRAQFHDTLGHTFQNYQAQIRLMVKSKFLVGVARRLAETIGTADLPPVREVLGRLAAQAAMVEGMVWGMEAKGHMQDGYFVPDKHLMYAAQVLTQELYPQARRDGARALRRRIDHAALIRARLGQPGTGGDHRKDPALADFRRRASGSIS